MGQAIKAKNSLDPHDNTSCTGHKWCMEKTKKLTHMQGSAHAHTHKRGSGKFKWRNKGFILNYYYPFCKFWSFSISRLLSSHKHFRMLDSLTEKLRNIRDAYISKVWRLPLSWLTWDTRIFSILKDQHLKHSFSGITDVNGVVNWFIICLHHFLNLSINMRLAKKPIW